MNNENYCNNCGKIGHYYHHCKLPIMSIGMVAFRKMNDEIQYLMIRRRDTLGYIDFMRGKYSVYNKDYIMNMLKQMTEYEKDKLLTLNFKQLWGGIWGDDIKAPNPYRAEEHISKEKYNALSMGILCKTNFYTLASLIEESRQYAYWTEPEWGFPKGRRNFQERDYDCALREFAEETGYPVHATYTIQNIMPFEEIFTGSNYKSYNHKYFVTYMRAENTYNSQNYDETEVSKMEWKSFDECMTCIRPYNLEKKSMLNRIHNTLLFGSF